MNKPSSPESGVPHDQMAVDWLTNLMQLSLDIHASDIHLEPFESLLRIRFRVDGLLHEMPTPPVALRERIVSRIKVLARLDIAEKRLPQDGRLQFPIAKRLIDMRVSTLPTLHGEKVVLRILDFHAERPGLAALGMTTQEQQLLLNAIQQPHGMVLITGPTGSGKTVTLYTCLDHLNAPEVNIATVEDPSEIILPGANQVNVNEKIGLNFANALRSLLRQDPDIIMLGEIRDTETADIAVKASQTGHLVLSTLHTNDAPSTLLRLQHMGIAGFNLASSLNLICAQRLVRRLCTHCKTPVPGQARYKAVGCAQCKGGYKGRIGIHQLMPISTALQGLILNQASVQAITHQARSEGMQSLRESGLRKVELGDTSLEEVMGATHAA
jgi:type IV pilus assembly protein PilB